MSTQTQNVIPKGFPDGSTPSLAGGAGKGAPVAIVDFTSGALLRKTNIAHPGQGRDRHRIPEIQ